MAAAILTNRCQSTGTAAKPFKLPSFQTFEKSFLQRSCIPHKHWHSGLRLERCHFQRLHSFKTVRRRLDHDDWKMRWPADRRPISASASADALAPPPMSCHSIISEPVRLQAPCVDAEDSLSWTAPPLKAANDVASLAYKGETPVAPLVVSKDKRKKEGLPGSPAWSTLHRFQFIRTVILTNQRM